jgi:CRP-like cAMP-binding protein
MHVLIRKLRNLHSLSEEEEAAMLAAVEPPRAVERGIDIVADGSTPTHSTVMISGVACRYKMFPDGRRQILSFQYPGDVTDLYGYVLKKLDHAVAALTQCTVSHIPHKSVQALCERYPNLAYALWRDTLVDTSKLHSSIMNLGRRSSKERIAHLLCEQVVRLVAVGLAQVGKPMSFQITQTDIADATGLSLVHVNKTLRKLKEDGLIGRNPSTLEIVDWDGLQETAGFDPGYLHFKRVDA